MLSACASYLVLPLLAAIIVTSAAEARSPGLLRLQRGGWRVGVLLQLRRRMCRDGHRPWHTGKLTCTEHNPSAGVCLHMVRRRFTRQMTT